MANETPLCGCITCTKARVDKQLNITNPIDSTPFRIMGPGVPGWRYGCEICGNKRCPHQTDHNLACTNSNEPGQKGSIYE